MRPSARAAPPPGSPQRRGCVVLRSWRRAPPEAPPGTFPRRSSRPASVLVGKLQRPFPLVYRPISEFCSGASQLLLEGKLSPYGKPHTMSIECHHNLKTLSNIRDRNEILQRLANVSPDAAPRSGRMNAPPDGMSSE